MNTIIYYSNYATITFAVEELKRLIRKSGMEVEVQHHSQPGVVSNSNTIFIMLEAEYNESPFCKKTINIKKDGFALIKDEDNVWIVGKEERSSLYGVYCFCEQKLGYQWVHLNEEVPQKPYLRTAHYTFDLHEPVFSRRGNIIETIDDPVYIRDLIDWGTKNGLNEFFFTFFLWNKIKTYIKEDLIKRHVHVTLGGHSLSYLLEEIKNDANFSSRGKDIIKFFAENTYMQDLVIKKIVDMCTTDPVITRISLWPEDVGIDEKQFSDFMPTYIAFIERLKTRLHENRLHVDVEHIVYNAGLAWSMLERNAETSASNQVDVLYAYWGRDYAQSINYASTEQGRAYASLMDWQNQAKQNGKVLTVLEYYSDHFMLSELFPPLLSRINQDFIDYKMLGINGVLNLIVPYHAKQSTSEITSKYPWKWIQQINNYFYAGLSWGKDFDLLVDTYFSTFGKNKEEYHSMLVDLEHIVSRHTKWNVPLFPARVVDPEKVINSEHIEEIIELLQEVIDFITSRGKNITENMIGIQNRDNYGSFSSEDMMKFYLYY